MAFNSFEDLPKAEKKKAITICGGDADADGFTKDDWRSAVANLNPDFWVRVVQPARLQVTRPHISSSIIH